MKTWVAASGMVASALVGISVGRWTAPSDSGASGGAAPPSKEFTGTVVRISDGDTLELAPAEPPGATEKVRLLGIDAPGQGKPLFKEAADALSAMTKSGSLRVEFESPGRGQRDEYGRVLAYLFASDTNVNVELVRQGWAEFSSKHGGERYAAELRGAEDEARAGKRGVWKGRK
jgi:micrococcal nuclease